MSMGIGAGIFLIVLGAILTVVGLNLYGVGWIVLLAGGAGLALYFYFWNRRRGHRAVVTARRTHGDSQPTGVISSGRADQARHHRLGESPRTAVNSQNLLVPTPQ